MFLATAVANLATYLTTSAQLALAFPDAASGFAGAFAKFGTIFAVTQIPLSVSEGLLSVVIFNLLTRYSQDELKALQPLGSRVPA